MQTLVRIPVDEIVPASVRERVVARLAKEQDTSLDLADRIFAETINFLVLCGQQHDRKYSPSTLVDEGWHTLILYTREYADLCNRLVGHFIHHVPTDEPGATYSSGNSFVTYAALVEAGFNPDPMIWASSAKCSDNYCTGDSCVNGDGDPGPIQGGDD